MIHMIPDTKLALDHGGNSLLSPDLANKAVSLSTAAQKSGKMLALLHGQFGSGARAWLIAQRINSTSLPTCDPLADCSFADAQSSSNLLLGPALLIEFPSAQAPTFAPICWLWWLVHAQHNTRV